MECWVYTLIFVFSILVVSRNVFLLVRKGFAMDPVTYALHKYELFLLGISISYIVTYLIY